MSTFKYMTMIGLAIAVVSSPLMADPASQPTSQPTANTGLADSAEEVQPLNVGDNLPELPKLKNAEGNEVDLAETIAGKKTVIVFYRGGWCPFCTKHLAEVVGILPQLNEAGAELIAISPDVPEKLDATAAKYDIPYTLLSDADHKVMKAFGIAFTVDPVTKEKYKGYGIQLQGASGNLTAALPVPSVFVFDEKSEVTFAHSDADYKTRLSGEDILKAAGVAAE